MKWLIIGIAATGLGLFFWMWALQDGSFAVAAGADGGEWQRRANNYVWIGYGFFAAAVAAFITAWLSWRRRSRPRA